MTVERVLPWLILATVTLSGLLLGMGQGDFEPFVVALLGAGSAMLLVDWWKWFRLPNWMANVLAIIVTVLTVSNFYFTNDSVRHLLGVGKLLVYLQTILMFQQKSPRVYWQVLVLSLLQIVVGAVFNLGFEGGVLFIIYMMVAGMSMMLLHLYQDRQAIRNGNEDVRAWAEKHRGGLGQRALMVSANPGVSRGLLRRMVSSFFVFALGALSFAILLFYFLPRDHSSWSGPLEVPMKNTGFDEQVDMDHDEMILLSSRLQMNVRYWYPGGNKPFQPNALPYLRGMALCNIKLDGNRTRWVPPPYQVYGSDFRPLDATEDPLWVIQEVVLEPTEDPLLYTAMPPRGAAEEELMTDFEWCWPLGGITRQRTAETITVSHFRYNLKIPVLDNGDFYTAYPYQPRETNSGLPLTSQDDPGNYRWLTWLERSRYPTLTQTASQIASRFDSGNHLSVARQMESLFRSDRFSYTLDFRDIDRDESLDTVEDFFANFRRGHCEYYASALALMLRSQGIPSRVVVGFRGGDINGFGGHLDVEAKHKHAWVEAYIRPQDCSDYLRRTGQAGPLGAWLRLDPTPATDLSNALTGADDALDFAKSLWRDYVLGLQSDSRSRLMAANPLRMSGWLRLLDLDWWQSSLRRFQTDLLQKGGWQRYAIPLLVIMLIPGLWWAWQRRGSKTPGNSSGGRRHGGRRRDSMRQRVARVLAVVAPGLAGRLAGSTARVPEVPFYSQMLATLGQVGFQRLPQQTGREFAADVAQRTSASGFSDRIGTLTKSITDFYYLVRFGRGELNDHQYAAVQESLKDLQDLLGKTAES